MIQDNTFTAKTKSEANEGNNFKRVTRNNSNSSSKALNGKRLKTLPIAKKTRSKANQIEDEIEIDENESEEIEEEVNQKVGMSEEVTLFQK